MSATNQAEPGEPAKPAGEPHGISGEWKQSGRARRHEGYEAVLALAQSCDGCLLTKIELHAALRYCSDLGRNEAILLGEYIDVIDSGTIATGNAYGFISTDLLEARTGLTDRAIRQARAGLERKGMAFRHYTVDNHPEPGQGFDLRPFLVRAAELIVMRNAAVDAVYARRAVNKSSYHGTKNARGEEESDRHIQSPTYTDSSVPPLRAEDETESASPADNLPQRRQDNLSRTARSNGTARNCSPGEHAVFSELKTNGRVSAETARAALTEAFQHSISLVPYVRQTDIDNLDLSALYAGAEKAVATLLPERQTLKTWQWAKQRHGWRAIIMLIVALDDPIIRDRYRVFGAFASGDAAKIEDGFRSNFKRIARYREELALAAEVADDAPDLPAAAEPPAIEHPDHAAAEDSKDEVPTAGNPEPPAEIDWAAQWPVFVAGLATLVGPAPFKHFFAGLSFVAGAPGMVLDLAVPTKFAADWIQQHYAEDMRAAALRMGWRCSRVRIGAAS